MSVQDNQTTEKEGIVLVQISEGTPTTAGDELTRIQNNIKEAHNLLATKGATIPDKDEDKTSKTLADTINTLVGTDVTYDALTQILRIVTC